MTLNQVIAGVMTVLQKNQTIVPATSIYEGDRSNNIVYPCLCVELGADRVVEYKYPYEYIIQVFKVGVFVQQYNKDHQLTDDGITKGIGTMINAMKLALTLNSNLNGLNDVIDVKIPSTVPGKIFFPMRDAVMSVEVMYRQNRQTRT